MGDTCRHCGKPYPGHEGADHFFSPRNLATTTGRGVAMSYEHDCSLRIVDANGEEVGQLGKLEAVSDFVAGAPIELRATFWLWEGNLVTEQLFPKRDGTKGDGA